MTMRECYEAMGADYGQVLGRLRSEQLIEKFVLKFLKDESYDLLCTSMESGDLESAFRASHTLKGICDNLGFSALGRSAHALTEALRIRDGEAAAALFPQVQTDHAKTVTAIQAYQAEL